MEPRPELRMGRREDGFEEGEERETDLTKKKKERERKKAASD